MSTNTDALLDSAVTYMCADTGKTTTQVDLVAYLVGLGGKENLMTLMIVEFIDICEDFGIIDVETYSALRDWLVDHPMALVIAPAKAELKKTQLWLYIVTDELVDTATETLDNITTQRDAAQTEYDSMPEGPAKDTLLIGIQNLNIAINSLTIQLAELVNRLAVLGEILGI
jgi:hypothetical protein